MYKVKIGSGYPDKFGTENLIKAISQHSVITMEDDEADFFIFPVFYEVLFEYTEQEYERDAITVEEIIKLKNQFIEMVEVSASKKKQILVFYYRDPVDKINIPNAVIFRTSLLQSTRENEFAITAFIEKDIGLENSLELLQKTEIPTVGFRGQSAPLKISSGLRIKRMINHILGQVKISFRFNLYYNFGYLGRRDAIIACLNNDKIKSDITITDGSQNNSDTANKRQLFLDNLFNNQYNICASGHGNYSYRLYETLCAGRIPVFINTDCVLPFEEFIDWKKHVVWIEEKDAYKADDYILKFHNSISDEDFLKLQKSNRALWEQYLRYEGFFGNIHKYFNILK